MKPATRIAGADFSCPARVYWEDTDGGGVVYYANYLKFLERARTEWLRTLGISQRALAAEHDLVFAVVELQVRYQGAARLDDLLHISCRPRLDGAASVVFTQEIRRDQQNGELLVQADVRVACLGATGFKPRRLPGFLRAELNSA